MSSIRKAIFLAVPLLAATANAQQPLGTVSNPPNPVQAWRHALLGGANNLNTGGVVNDASGYAYIFYVDGPNSGRIGHLLKLGPANSTQWRMDFFPPAGSYQPRQILITPKGVGPQFIYVVAQAVSASSVPYIYVKKFDTNGADLWPGGVMLDITDSTMVGAGLRTSGDLVVAAEGGNASKFLELYHVFPNGIFTGVGNTSIDPNLNLKAYYDSTTNAWFLAGESP